MSLLESVIALVILSLSAIGVLELFQETNRAASRAEEWTIAAEYAEEGIEAAKLGASAVTEISSTPIRAGYSRQFRSRPAAHGLTDVSVVVGIPGGASLIVHRLIQPR